MKTVQNRTTKEVSRVRDEQAERLVVAGAYKYVPKHLFKEQGQWQNGWEDDK